MNKVALKLLLKKYRHEFSRMNIEHLKDAIAILVILELNKPFKFDNDEICYITLNNLMNLFAYLFKSSTKSNNNNNKPTDIYEVPSLKELKQKKRKIDRELFLAQAISYGKPQERAGLVWLILMIKSGLIKEKQEIDTYDYKLIDFINDPVLLKVLNIEEEKSNDNLELTKCL